VRTLKPITVASTEGASSQTWNPLRRAATFIATKQGGTGLFAFSVETTLYLTCPSAAITQEISGAPSLIPPSAKEFRLRIYDAKEEFVRDVKVSNCACLTTLRLTDIDVIYQRQLPGPVLHRDEGF
jgi:hypothetical protein